MAPPFAALVGPTASGKSELALALAERLPIEIISADSRQVYRGMDIGTATPTAADRRRVSHHLLDIVEPDRRFTVAEWVAQARGLLPEIADRGRMPLIVGGTGLYVSALVEGFDFDAQSWSSETRARLADELEIEGLAPLAARLTHLAPEVAANTDLRNPRRVMRALERAQSGDVKRPHARAYSGAVTLIGIERPRDVLAVRIEQRTRGMFAAGLVDETQRLLEAGYGVHLSSMSGHGYREAAELLAGERTVEEAIATTVRRTRQYAKRQMTWFRRDRNITWLPAGDRTTDTPALVAAAREVLETSA